jgi:hypothetical protein
MFFFLMGDDQYSVAERFGVVLIPLWCEDAGPVFQTFGIKNWLTLSGFLFNIRYDRNLLPK